MVLEFGAGILSILQQLRVIGNSIFLKNNLMPKGDFLWIPKAQKPFVFDK
jgi:hypothetical protein